MPMLRGLLSQTQCPFVSSLILGSAVESFLFLEMVKQRLSERLKSDSAIILLNREINYLLPIPRLSSSTVHCSA